MLDAPPKSPSRRARLRNPSGSYSSAPSQAASYDPSFSLLLSLPRELRERIYHFTLTSPYPFWWPNQAPLKHLVGVNLLRTCKQVYAESVSILYSANKFLFTHPSDCNIFRVVASPASQDITCVYFRIREKDLRLWTTYLGSKTGERSLKFDLPKLKHLWIFMRCGSMGTPAMLGQLAHGGLNLQGLHAGGMAGLPPAVVVQVQAVQNALGQQVAALQQQVQALNAAQDGDDTDSDVPRDNSAPPGYQPATQHQPATQQPAMPFVQFQQGMGHPFANNTPPPPPPPPPPPHQHGAQQGNVPQILHHHHQHGHHHGHAQPHTLYNSFLRFEREMGIESLCLSLQETRRKETEVKIVCIMRIPKREVDRLYRIYPEELERDRHGDARTRFRKLHGVEVSLEISGYDVPGTGGGQ